MIPKDKWELYRKILELAPKYPPGSPFYGRYEAKYFEVPGYGRYIIFGL